MSKHQYGFGDQVRITGGDGVGKIGYLLNPWGANSTYWHIYHDETVCSSWYESQFELAKSFDPAALVAVCVEWYTTGQETQTQRDANLLQSLRLVMSEAVMPTPQEPEANDLVRQRLEEIMGRHALIAGLCSYCTTVDSPTAHPCDAYTAAHIALAALDG